MSRYSYETYAEMQKANAQAKTKKLSKVGYFKLSDGEEAIVRFNIASPADLEIVTTHTVKVNDRFRNVSCLRDSVKESLDKCPLCASGVETKTRVYVKLLRYNIDELGKVTSVDSVVANFPKRYADNLNTLIQEYDDLRPQIFKIERTGSDKNTTYTIVYGNPIKYSEANGFVKDFSDFEGFDLVPHSFIERSKEDIETYLATGDFPMPVRKETTEEVPTHPGVQQQEEMMSPFKETPVGPDVRYHEPHCLPSSTTATTTQTTPEQTGSRPRRNYDWDK